MDFQPISPLKSVEYYPLVFRKHLDLFFIRIYAIYLNARFLLLTQRRFVCFQPSPPPSRSAVTVCTIENGRVTVVLCMKGKSAVDCTHYRFNVFGGNCGFRISACESNGGHDHKTFGVERIR